MSSSRCIYLTLRSLHPCRASTFSRPGYLGGKCAFSTANVVRAVAGQAYLQKPDKTHPTRTDALPAAAASQTTLRKKGKFAAKPKKPQPELRSALSQEDQLKDLEKLQEFQHLVSWDPWSQPLALLDLHVPSLFSKRQDASIVDHLRSVWYTQINGIKNAIHMWQAARANSFPGVRVSSPWSLQIFRIKSTAWLAPFRSIALQTYKDVYSALAAGDTKTLKKLTVGEHHEHILRLLRAQDRSRVYVWELVKEESPCKVVSLRTVEGNFGKEPPKFGNRYVVQALVKFDTLQTLRVYNKKGDLVGGDEKPRRVEEYLVFTKRMWYDGPWVIRDQIFENMDTKITSIA